MKVGNLRFEEGLQFVRADRLYRRSGRSIAFLPSLEPALLGFPFFDQTGERIAYASCQKVLFEIGEFSLDLLQTLSVSWRPAKTGSVWTVMMIHCWCAITEASHGSQVPFQFERSP